MADYEGVEGLTLINKFEHRSKDSYDRVATGYDNSPEERCTYRFNPFLRLSPASDVRLYSPKEITDLLTHTGFVCDPVIVEGNLQLVLTEKPAANELQGNNP